MPEANNMKTFYDDNGFEEFLRTSVEDFRLIPNPKVWRSIYNHFHPGSKLPSSITALAFVALFSLAGFLHTSKSFSSKNEHSLISTNSSLEKTAASKINTNQNSVYGSNSSPIWDDESINILASTNTIANVTPAIGLKENKALNFSIAGSNINVEQDEFVGSEKKARNRAAIAKSSQNLVVQTGAVVKNTIDTDFEGEASGAEAESIQSTSAAPENNKVANEAQSSLFKLTKQEVALLFEKERTKLKNLDIRQPNIGVKLNLLGLNRKKLSIEYYVTPSIGYRTLALSNDNASARSSFLPFTNNSTGSVAHGSAFNVEVGFAYSYQVKKKVQLKAGVQLNVTRYKVKGTELAHPFTTVVPSVLNAIPQNSLATVANTIDGNDWSASSTYQISLPVGAYFSALNKKKWSVYAGASLQPTYVFGGNIKLLSSDKQYYSNELEFLRRFNFNVGAEAFVQYRLRDVSIIAGPQIRYQLLSTFKNSIAHKENLYNVGFKVGISKRL